MSRRTLTIVLVAFFILLSAGFMAWYFHVSRSLPKQLAVLGQDATQHVDTFTFYNQEGRVITNKDVAGKVYVAEYFFATCEGMCPKMNEQMKRVYEAYRGNPEVLMLSHTVDPKKDTVAALRKYAERFNADPKQWMFLTGDKKRLYDMARYSYLINAEDTVNKSRDIVEDFIHDQHFVLIDRTGHLRGKFYDALHPADIDSLISDIHVLLAEPVK